jgi:hypothetical protein
MIELMLIILRWAARFLLGEGFFARQELVLIPIRANSDSRRSGYCPANSFGVGWMAMRLDPVSLGYVLSQSVPPGDISVGWPWSVPYKGPQRNG